MDKNWKLRSADDQEVATLREELHISPSLCRILVERGIRTFGEARDFFRPSLDQLHDPFLMKDMETAVTRILRAVDTAERILVYGDYDVDGTTAVAVLYRFLRTLLPPGRAGWYVPHRYREGYGVSMQGIEHARSNGFSLIISLDCGIKSLEPVAHAIASGIDFIVCDHHLPDERLPPATAILNPKQADCPYPYKELCGCGIAFKLVTALCRQLGLSPEIPLEYLDLVATAISADIVPVTGENRVLAYFGLQHLNTRPCPGLKALIELGGTRKAYNIHHVAFIIAPSINAAGRMDDATKAVELFIETDEARALERARELHLDNSDRKETDSAITTEALAILEADGLLSQKKSTVVFRPHWHKGVVGIVASRLIEKYYRPTVVLASSGALIGGSARSVPGFNLYEAVHACREHLVGYGGHFAAAGLTLLPEKMDAFAAKFEEVVSATIAPELLVPRISVDAEIRFPQITTSWFGILCQMEPFGPGNPRPVFMSTGVTETGWSRIVKEEHVRFVLEQDGVTLTGIGFNLASKFHLLSGKRPIDIVYTVDENEWNGQKTLQLKMLDLRLPEEQPNTLQRD